MVRGRRSESIVSASGTLGPEAGEGYQGEHRMTFFPSLSANAGLAEIQAPYRDIWLLWGKFSQALMRGPGPLSIAERELVAAYVSDLNDCEYCFKDHAMAAEAFGIDADVFNNLMDDIDSSSVDESADFSRSPIFRVRNWCIAFRVALSNCSITALVFTPS